MSGPVIDIFRRCLSLAAVVLLGLLLGSTAAAAQSATASIEGTVTDPSGAPVPGVTVVLTQQATGVTRETLVWQEALPDWTEAGRLPEFSELFS